MEKFDPQLPVVDKIEKELDGALPFHPAGTGGAGASDGCQEICVKVINQKQARRALALTLAVFLIMSCQFFTSEGAQPAPTAPVPASQEGGFAAGTSTPEVFPTVPVTPSSSPSGTPTASSFPDVVPTLPAIPVQFITNGSREKAYVALTFDVCQDPNYPAWFDAGIVNVLLQYNVPATFFMGGDWMRTHPDETMILAQNPSFELGNHSWSHPDLRTLSEDEISQEVVLTQEMLFALTGRQAHLFRLPSGFFNDLALETIAKQGLYTIQWDVVTGDPDPNFDAATIQRAVREGTQNGSIIIMHANGRGWHTAEALPSVIEYLQAQGYELVTVSQLIGLEPIP